MWHHHHHLVYAECIVAMDTMLKRCLAHNGQLSTQKSIIQKIRMTSVANAAVYPSNWASLKSPAAGQKTVGQVA